MLESVLISIDGREKLAEEIVKAIRKKSSDPIVVDYANSQKFSDGELCVDFCNSIRGKRVYLLTSPNNSDEIIKLNLAIDAAKRAAAAEIIVILPYFPYARQDKKDQKRGPIGAKVMVEMIEHRGTTGVITFDLHADQILKNDTSSIKQQAEEEEEATNGHDLNDVILRQIYEVDKKVQSVVETCSEDDDYEDETEIIHKDNDKLSQFLNEDIIFFCCKT
jgi:ribose-phosphate pyrophosphokinase